MKFLNRLLVSVLPFVPRFIVERVARRYVAGPRIEDAVATIRTLNGQGACATVDILGEEVSLRDKALAFTDEYLRVLETIRHEKIDSNVSIKLTMLGLKIDEKFCRDNVERIVVRAAELGNFVRIDMEDRTCTDATLNIYRELRQRYDNLGVVLQAYMRRTPADVEALARLKPSVRLCKGIYIEPRRVAWQAFETVRENYTYSLQKLFDAGCYVGIATHDEHLVWGALREIERRKLQRDKYEFQVLLGVDPELRQMVVDAGHKMRVYVPYGRDWYAYSLRRLRENPRIGWHIAKAFLGF